MPNDLTVRAASLTATAFFAGTNQQFSNAIRAYCSAMGVDTSGTNQQVLNRFIQFLYDDVKRVAREHTRQQKRLAKQDEVDDEVDEELGSSLL